MIERLALTVFALALASACATKGPPPRVAEVPIDDGTPRMPGPPIARSGSDGAGSAQLTGDPVGAFGLGGAGGGGAGGGDAAMAAAAAALGGGAMGLPVQLPAMKDVGPAGGGGATTPPATAAAKPLPPKAERLTAVECNKVMDKYIELVGISQGISPDAIAGVMTMLRNSVSGDANYANALGACAKENTKTQYRCAMKAGDVDAWKACLQ